MIIEVIKSIILGIIQGITEWLPISSTGHMLLADEFLKMDVSQDFMKMFEVVIQLGSILAVVVLFFNKLNPFSLKKTGIEKKETWSMWLRVLIGIVPAGIIGILLDDIISEHLGTPFIIAFTIILYGVLFIVVESRKMSLMLPKYQILRIKRRCLLECSRCLPSFREHQDRERQ